MPHGQRPETYPRPTNYARIERDLPAREGGEGWPTEPDFERVEQFVGELRGIDDTPLREAVEDIVRSLSPEFLPADAQSRYPANGLLDDKAPDVQVRGGLRARAIRTSTDADNPVAVSAWQYNATHVLPMGWAQATFRDISFEGVTIEAGGVMTRYIDWTFAMAQMGIVGTQRPMLGELTDVDGQPVVARRADHEPPPEVIDQQPDAPAPGRGIAGWIADRLRDVARRLDGLEG